MSALTFRLREPPPERLDLSVLIPQKLAGLTAKEVARLSVGTSRRGAAVGDVFDIAMGDVSNIRIEGGSTRFDRVGEGLAAGQITVEGDVGQRLGFGMSGGEIRVSGSAGPFAASAATAGVVRIEGDAEECAGGAVHGAMHGLNGAVLVIGGRAGPRLGDRMKRGLILTKFASQFAGCRMIAGTILAEEVGDHAGYGMRRGTILVRQHGRLTPTFVETGRHRFVFLHLLRRELERFPEWSGFVPEYVTRHAGDMATLGKGEILTPCA